MHNAKKIQLNMLVANSGWNTCGKRASASYVDTGANYSRIAVPILMPSRACGTPIVLREYLSNTHIAYSHVVASLRRK